MADKNKETEVAKTQKRNTEYRSYNENDYFSYQEKPVFSVLDFWKYHYSHLVGEEGVIGEFLVAKALGIEKAENVLYWSAYDMSYRGMRIEVKATAYVHPWNKTKVSQVRTFSIAPSKNAYWEGNNHQACEEFSRQSDVYVFCLNTNQNIGDANPLKVDDWEFYIIPTSKINEYTRQIKNPNQKKISLSVVKRLSGEAVRFSEIKGCIDSLVEK